MSNSVSRFPILRTLTVAAFLGLASQHALAQPDEQQSRSLINQTDFNKLAQATVSPQKQKEKSAAKESGAVTLLNCSDRAVTVKVFNSGDEDMVVPTQTDAIATGLQMTLHCATSKCKLVVEALKSEPKSGYLVYMNRRLMQSDAASVAKGCRQFE
jgi:membrane-bound inhibitor of C-type lysozyme